jgi:hypothetical protein
VVRDIKTVARRTLRSVSHERGVHRLSHLLTLSVDGEPALAVAYLLKAEGKEWNVRQVFVRHGEWIYYIQVFLPPHSQLTSSTVDELLHNWHWQ